MIENTPIESLPLDFPGASSDTRTLDELETVISRGLETFMEVGKALAAVRVNSLYREKGYGTFKEYCRGEWELGPRRAQQLMQASRVVEDLQTRTPGTPLPTNEKQSRPLARIPDPEMRSEVWQKVNDKAEGVITTSLVEDTVDEYLSTKTENADESPRKTEGDGCRPDDGSDAHQVEVILSPKPEPTEEEKRQKAAAKWEQGLSETHKHLFAIRHLGGVGKLTKLWSRPNKEAMLDQITRFVELWQEQEQELRKELGK